MKLFDALNQYLESVDNTTTKINYEIVLREFLKNTSRISDISTEKIANYKASLCDKAPQTIAAKLAAIRSFCYFCAKEKWISSDPSLPIRNDPFKKYEQSKNISFEDFQKILGFIDLTTIMGLRDRMVYPFTRGI
jgi:site-specific recombinase XerD